MDLCWIVELYSILHLLPLTEDWKTDETVWLIGESFMASWLDGMKNSELCITSGLFNIQSKVDTSGHHIKMRSIKLLVS